MDSVWFRGIKVEFTQFGEAGTRVLCHLPRYLGRITDINTKENNVNDPLDTLASECILAQANAKWDSRSVLLQSLDKAYQLGKQDGIQATTDSLDVMAEEETIG